MVPTGTAHCNTAMSSNWNVSTAHMPHVRRAVAVAPLVLPFCGDEEGGGVDEDDDDDDDDDDDEDDEVQQPEL